MYDIEEFRSFAVIHRWTARSGFEGENGLYLMESDAKTLIDKIDRLEDVFFDVINKLVEIKEEYAITFYYDRIKSIKDTYIERQVKAKIEVFEDEICTKRKGHSDYKRIKEKAKRVGISESEDYNKFLAKCFVENFDKLPNYTSKANYIAYFEETVKQYFLYDTLFEIINKGKKPKKEKTKTTIRQYALFYYYIQTSKEFPLFDNHPGGKVKGIEELVKNEGFTNSFKYFQTSYNFISNHKTNRIALNQVSNISYVIDNMLIEFPKAKQLALLELKEAKTKNR